MIEGLLFTAGGLVAWILCRFRDRPPSPVTPPPAPAPAVLELELVHELADFAGGLIAQLPNERRRRIERNRLASLIRESDGYMDGVMDGTE